jgi:alpha,alpha-trehalose phosphorylase
MVPVAGFGGLRDHSEELSFAPSLPGALQRVAFRLVFRGRRLRVEIVPGEARYELLSGEPIELLHDGRPAFLSAGAPLVLPWSPRGTDHRVEPPQGREALRRGVGADLDAPVHQPT